MPTHYLEQIDLLKNRFKMHREAFVKRVMSCKEDLCEDSVWPDWAIFL